MAEKKTFTSEKIRTSEICGLSGTLTIGTSNVSGVSGTFDDLTVDGVRYIPRDQIAYAFRFGGPPVDVPSRLPIVTGSTNYTGLVSGQDLVFVENTESFYTGDHIIINPGGLYADGNPQEEQTITGVSYYRPTNCCNASTYDAYSAGATTLYHNNENSILAGDHIKFYNSNTLYKVTNNYGYGGDLRSITINPALQKNVSISGCMCVVQPTLRVENNLSNNYPTGTKVASKFGKTSTTLSNREITSGDPHWNNVSLLISSNNVDGDTAFADSSSLSNGVTGYGNVHHESGSYGSPAYKFGSSSIQFNGIGDYLRVDGTPVDFGNEDFTMEGWFKRSRTNSKEIIMGNSNTTIRNGVTIVLGDGTWQNSRGATVDDTDKLIAFFAYGYDGINPTTTSHYVVIIGSTNITDTNWHHFAAVREKKSLVLYLDGVREGTAFDGLENDNVTENILSELPDLYTSLNNPGLENYYLTLGTTWDQPTNAASETSQFSGYMEDVRVTKKIARYTNNFTPPTGNFENFVRASVSCDSTCYDTRYLYVDKGVSTGYLDWYLTGYREYFIDFSGIDVHMTGDNTTGLLTLVYPDQGI